MISVENTSFVHHESIHEPSYHVNSRYEITAIFCFPSHPCFSKSLRVRWWRLNNKMNEFYQFLCKWTNKVDLKSRDLWTMEISIFVCHLYYIPIKAVLQMRSHLMIKNIFFLQVKINSHRYVQWLYCVSTQMLTGACTASSHKLETLIRISFLRKHIQFRTFTYLSLVNRRLHKYVLQVAREYLGWNTP